MSDNLQAQQDEIVVLESIYGPDFKTLNSEEEEMREYELNVRLQIPQGCEIEIQVPNYDKILTPRDDISPTKSVILHHLPPWKFRFSFPTDYPSSRPPHFSISSPYLGKGQLTRLCTSLRDMWDESPGDVIMFRWVEWLQENALSVAFSVPPLSSIMPSAHGDDTRRVTLKLEEFPLRHVSGDAKSTESGDSKTPIPTLTPIDQNEHIARARRDQLRRVLGLLESWDESEDKREFESDVHVCSICFADYAGVDAFRFKQCRHVFCRNCLKGYFHSQIDDGSVHSLRCPTPKCKVIALPTEVRSLVDSDHYNTYETKLLEKTLGEMNDVIWCPIKSCQSPVLKEQDSNLAMCPKCSFSFCIECEKAWHGLVPCANLSERYRNASEEEKKELERRYPRIFDEMKSFDWKSQNTTQCPRCHTPIFKAGGCNHMTCGHCSYEFCWLCKARYTWSHFELSNCRQFTDVLDPDEVLRDAAAAPEDE